MAKKKVFTFHRKSLSIFSLSDDDGDKAPRAFGMRPFKLLR